MNGVDARNREERDVLEEGLVAHAADDGAVLPSREVRAEPRGLHAFPDMVDLGVGGARGGDDDHARSSGFGARVPLLGGTKKAPDQVGSFEASR
jgi:hypothetical protein